MSSQSKLIGGRCDECRSTAGLIQTVDNRFLCSSCYNAEAERRMTEIEEDDSR